MTKPAQYFPPGLQTDVTPPAGTLGSGQTTLAKAPRNLDVVPGLLDLPSGPLTPATMRRYVNALALFYEHIIIPDGWLHCRGPVSEYLRGELGRARSKLSNATEPTYLNNPIFGLLDSEILIPALRGRRPEREGDEPLGFNLYDVWTGAVKGPGGKTEGFGVNFADPQARMMILDGDPGAEGDENRRLIADISSRVRKFVAWNGPGTAIDKAGFDEDGERRRWDGQLTELVDEFAVWSSFGQATVDELLNHGVSLDGPTRLELLGFWDEVAERVDELVGASRTLRRGHVEQAVAESLGIGQLRSYLPLLRATGYTELNVINPYSAVLRPSGVALPLKSFVASVLLDRVTTIQQGMFSKQFSADLGMARTYSLDVATPEVLRRLGFGTEVGEFVPEDVVLSESPIPFENLTPQQIVALRRANKDYFDAMKGAVPSAEFFKTNRELREALVKYIADISREAPLGAERRSWLAAARAGVVGTAVVALVRHWGVSLELAGVASILLATAERLAPPIAKLLTKRLDAPIADVLKRARDRRQLDITLRMLSLQREKRVDMR